MLGLRGWGRAFGGVGLRRNVSCFSRRLIRRYAYKPGRYALIAILGAHSPLHHKRVKILLLLPLLSFLIITSIINIIPTVIIVRTFLA